MLSLTPEVIALVGSGLASIATIIFMFVRLTWWLSNQFSEQRQLSYRLHRENNQRFLRLELWANRRGFQPAIDPLDFNGGGDSHHEETH